MGINVALKNSICKTFLCLKAGEVWQLQFLKLQTAYVDLIMICLK